MQAYLRCGLCSLLVVFIRVAFRVAGRCRRSTRVQLQAAISHVIPNLSSLCNPCYVVVSIQLLFLLPPCERMRALVCHEHHNHTGDSKHHNPTPMALRDCTVYVALPVGFFALVRLYYSVLWFTN